MYKKQSNQISLEDFNQPIGLNLSPDNRWVKKAAIIPWDEIEDKYAGLFQGKTGQVAKSARLVIGALLIQVEYGYSDKETVEQIKENPYMQYFCGMSGYHYCRPFDASSMTRFRKRLSENDIADINEMIISYAENSKNQNQANKESTSSDNEKNNDDNDNNTKTSRSNSKHDLKDC